MPDVSINDLPAASSLQDSGLLVVYQNSQTQSVTGQKVKSYAAEAAEEIAEPVAAAAVEDKFDDMTVTAETLTPGSQATATYDPETNTLELGIPRGADGGGAGDMTKAVYDPDDEVYEAGGIPEYVTGRLPTYVTTTMTAAGWSNSQYSFEASYPSASYDIAISVAPTATEAQFDAFAKAKICGSASNNIVKALGTVPTVNVPIIIKVVAR